MDLEVETGDALLPTEREQLVCSFLISIQIPASSALYPSIDRFHNNPAYWQFAGIFLALSLRSVLRYESTDSYVRWVCLPLSIRFRVQSFNKADFHPTMLRDFFLFLKEVNKDPSSVFTYSSKIDGGVDASFVFPYLTIALIVLAKALDRTCTFLLTKGF